MKWDDVLNDTTFQEQPPETKRKVAEGYFNTHIATDPTYQAEAPEIQERARSGFFNTIGPPQLEPTVKVEPTIMHRPGEAVVPQGASTLGVPKPTPMPETLEAERTAQHRADVLKSLEGSSLTPEEKVKAQERVSAGEFPLWATPQPGAFYTKTPKERATEVVKSFAAGAGGTMEGVAGAVQWLGGEVNIRPVSDFGKYVADIYEEGRKQLTPKRPDFWSDLSSGFGSMASFLLPGVGTEMAAARLTTLSPRVAAYFGATAMAANEALAESGNVYRESMTDKKDTAEAEKAARITFVANMPLLLVTNKLGLFAERGSVLRKALMSSLMEGAQEAGQAGISETALGRPLDPTQMLYEGTIGAIVGGGAGIVMSRVDTAIEKARATSQMPQEVLDAYTEALTAARNDKVPEEKAHVMATRAVSEMPEGKEYLEQVADAADSVLKAEAMLEQLRTAETAPAEKYDLPEDRRVNPELRAKIDDLITRAGQGDATARDELYQVYHDEHGSGLLSGIGYREVQKKANTLFFDLDNFKEINDKYGHEGANQILREVGKRLSGFQSADFVAARVWGDEFEATHDSPEHLEKVAKYLTDILNRSKIRVDMPDGSTVYHTTGIGLSYGIGKGRTDAEARAVEHKQERAKQGLRYERVEGIVSRPAGEAHPRGTGAATPQGLEVEYRTPAYDPGLLRHIQSRISETPAKEAGKPALASQQNIVAFAKSRGGINFNREHLKGELRNLVENNPRLKFTVNKKGKGLTLDELREAAVEQGFLNEDATLNDLIQALQENRQHPSIAEKIIEPYSFSKFKKKRILTMLDKALANKPLTPAQLDVLDDLIRSGAEKEYQKAQVTSPEPILTPTEAKVPVAKPTQKDLFGPGKETLGQPLPSEELPETELEVGKREAEGRAVEAEEKGRQGELPVAKKSWEMTIRERTGTVGNLYYSPFKDLLNIAEGKYHQTGRIIPKAQMRDAEKLFDYIKSGDLVNVNRLLNKYFNDAFVKGNVQGGPKQVKAPDVIKARLGELAKHGRVLLEEHQKTVQQALSEGKPVPEKVLRDYPELAKDHPLIKPLLNEEGALDYGKTYDQVKGMVDGILEATGTKLDPKVREKVIKDLETFNKYINTPKYLGEKHTEFMPIFRAAQGIYQMRDQSISEFIALEAPYYALSKISRGRVNRAIEEGTLKAEVWSDAQLKDIYRMNDKEIEAYHGLRKKYDAALEMLVDFYEELGGKREDIEEEISALVGYAPLSRFGKWAVTVRGDKDELLEFQIFESRFKARKYANKVSKEQGIDVTVSKLLRGGEQSLFEGIDPATLSIFAKVAKINPDVAGAFMEGAEEFFKGRGFRKHFIHREGTPGYSKDWERVHADYSVGLSSYMARVRGIKAMKEALKGIDATQKPRLYEYAQDYIKYMEKPGEEAQRLRHALFFYYLGGNVKSAVLNLTQTITTTLAYLGQYARFASKDIAHAASDVARAIKIKDGRPHFDHSILGKELSEALQAAEGKGVVSEQMVYELMAKARGQLLVTHRHRVARGLVYLFGTAETFNRRVAFIAAYRIGKKLEAKGTLPEGIGNAQAFAEKVVEDTQFVYGRYNRPTIARGPVGATFFTFKTFMLQYLEMASKMARANGENIRRGQFIKAMGIMFMMAGLTGLPFAGDLKKLFEWWTQINIDNKAREWSEELLGDPRWGEVFLKGITRLTPIDMSGAIGLGDIVPEMGTISALGPFGGVIQRIYRAVPWLQRGEYLRATETVSPELVRNLLAAWRIWNEGHRNRLGDLIFSGEGRWSKEINTIAKSMSFLPSDLARAYERERAQTMIGGWRSKKKSAWVYRLAKASIDQNMKEKEKILGEIREYNTGKPIEDMVLISSQDVNNRVRMILMPEDYAGFKGAARQERPEYLKVKERFK